MWGAAYPQLPLGPFLLFWGFVSGMELSTLESRAFK